MWFKYRKCEKRFDSSMWCVCVCAVCWSKTFKILLYFFLHIFGLFRISFHLSSLDFLSLFLFYVQCSNQSNCEICCCFTYGCASHSFYIFIFILGKYTERRGICVQKRIVWSFDCILNVCETFIKYQKGN